MDTEMETPSEYLLLFRGTNWDQGLSAEQIQRVTTRWTAWFEGLVAQGVVQAGQPLVYAGKIVSGRGGRTIMDGPFAESKEAIGGYFLVRAENEAAAIEVARQCPALEHGMAVEVRPVAARCGAHRATGTREVAAAG